jgi:hypothetical protein
MNVISLNRLKEALRFAIVSAAATLAAYGQTTQINLATQGRNVDFTGAPSTKPVKTGTALPAACQLGEFFFKTNAVAGQNLYGCTSANTWTILNPAPVATPVGAIVGTTDTQTLSNKSIDASEINSGTLSPSRLPAANPTPGTFGDATHTPQVTVDGTGRVTVISQLPIALTGGLGDPGSNGVVVRTAANTTSSVAAPIGAIVGATDTQTLTNKSIDASEITSGTLSSNTFPVINTTPGTFGDATHSAQVTVDAKGRVTAVSQLPVAASAGLGDPGSNGVVVRTAANVTSSVAAPAGALVGTSATQTLTNKSIDASEIASGTLSATRLPAFSGDISTATGSTAATLPTVNTTPGTFGDATHSAQVTVDAKGRITSVSQLPVTATAGLIDPGFNGVVIRTAADVTTSVTAPGGAIVGTTDTQTLTNKSIDASEINSGTLAAARVAVLNQSTTGNAATATALAAAPALCPAGQAPTGILANGNATGCAAISSGSGGAATPATTNVLVGTGVANGVAAGVPNVNYLAPANPAMTGAPTVNGNKIGIFRVPALPSSCVVGTDSSLLFASGGTDAVYACDNTGHYSIPPGGSTTVLGGDVTGVGSANTLTKIGGNPVGTLATQNAPAVGIVTSDGTNLGSRAAPVGVIVGVTDTQTLTNKSIDASEINTGILAAGRIPAFSGDIATVAGSTASALAAVNTTPGTFGDSTHSAQITVDAKGRITSVSQLSVAPNGLADPGANGLVVRTAVNATSVVTPPTGAIVGVSDTQTLTNKSIDASEINSGTIAAARIPVLNQNTTGNAGTATALAAAPSQCTGQFATGVAAGGNANCAAAATILGYTPQNAATANPNNDALGAAAAAQAAAEAFSANAANISSGTIAAARVPVLNQNTTGNASTATALASTPTVCATGQAPRGILANGNATGCAVSGGGGLQTPPATGIITGTIGSTVTGSIPAPAGAVVGTTDTQTLTGKSIDASEINIGTLSAARFPAFSGDIVTAAGSTAATLPTVNSSPGTFGDSTHTAQLTVDGKGRVTGLTLLAITGVGGGASIASGALSTLPVSCSTGTLYFVTDQTAGQQLYTCSSANTWTQLVNLGGSGALLFTGGSLDINPAVVPRLAAANTFTGPTAATNGLSLLTANTQPACSASARGTFWYLNNGSAKDNVQVCVYNGSAFIWTSLY